MLTNTITKNNLRPLAELKRNLQIGNSLTLVESPDLPNHRGLNVKRYIVKKQGNGVYLNPDKQAKNGSFLEFNNAKLTEYDGEEIRTYKPGKRELTEDERRIYNNRPSQRKENEKLLERDILGDGSTTYWMDKKYLSDNNMSYIFDHDGSKRYDYNSDMIIDEQIKGDLSLRYIIEN